VTNNLVGTNPSFLVEHFAAILPVISALVAGFLVFAATLIKEYLVARAASSKDRRRWMEEYYKIQLSGPILDYLDKVLEHMAEVYWALVDKTVNKEIQLPLDRVTKFRNNESKIRSRVLSIGDDNMVKDFDKVMHIFGKFRNRVLADKMNEAYEMFKDAQLEASKIYGRLGEWKFD